MGTIVDLPNAASPGDRTGSASHHNGTASLKSVATPPDALSRAPGPRPGLDLESSGWSAEHEERESGPRPLRSQSWITLQTMQAQRLVRGRKASESVQRIIGLAGFGTMLKVMWLAARADDPWADWWLIRVHDALEQADQELEVLVAHVNQVLSQLPGVSIEMACSDEPLRIPLAFSNPYGFRGAYLLSKFDTLVRTALTARHVAMLSGHETNKLIQDGGRQVRRAYLVADGYQCRKVTRLDVRRNSAQARDARARMGPVPAEILEGRLRAAFAPPIVPSIAPADNGDPGAGEIATEV